MSLSEQLGSEFTEVVTGINEVLKKSRLPGLTDEGICLLALDRIANEKEMSWEEVYGA